jgi:hypothetical protein
MAISARIDEEAKKLYLELDLTEPTESASGKTMSVFTSHGNVDLGISYDSKPLVAGINIYYRLPKKGK